MLNLSRGDYVIEQGDRIAQLVVARYEPVEWEESNELGDSRRGESGFGSSGI
jgi:dUTP pyrophosphatase